VLELSEAGIDPAPSPWGNMFWSDIPKEIIADFLDRFESHPHNFSFYTPEDEKHLRGLGKFVRETQELKLQKWDVVIPNGQEPPKKLFDTRLEIKPSRRGVILKDSGNTIMVSGTKARVGSRGIEREGLSKDVAEKAGDDFLASNPDKKGVPDKVYREKREKPLLLLYIITPYENDKDISSSVSPDGDPLVAVGLSFPRFNDSSIANKVSYRVNLVEWQNKFEAEIDDDMEDEDD
jgi:hypothetical protein